MSLLSRCYIPLLLTSLAVAGTFGCNSTGTSDEGGSTIFPPPEPEVQSFPRWSPDGERILYYDHGVVRFDSAGRARHDRSRKGLWTMRPDGSDRRQVLAGGSLYGDWSPSGDSLVFERGGQIYKAAFTDGVVDTTTIIRLTPSGRYFFPAWDPTGSRVAYSNSIGDTTGVWLSPLDGSRSKEYFARGGKPEWFPDGQRLLYACDGGLCVEEIGHSSRIKIFPSPEGDQSRLIKGSSVSPNDNRVAAGIDSQIWVMDGNGTDQQQLTEIDERWYASGQPDWSPDGTHIVYVGPNHTIWKMRADGSKKTQLTTRPDWDNGEGSDS